MRKLSIVLLVGLMLIGGAVGVVADSEETISEDNVEDDVTADFEIKTIAALYVGDTDVDLGTLEADDYDIGGSEDDSGWGDTELTSDEHYVAAFANDQFDVTVDGEETGDNNLSDTTSFQMNGGELDDDSTVIDSEDTVLSGDSGFTDTDDREYKYVPDAEDEPGNYTVTVTYTVSTS